MISDELFADCLVILQDASILEEDQAERISELISKKTSLEGSALENEVLDVLWRHRNKASPTSSPPIRTAHTIIRRASPAPWQFARVSTPTPSIGGTPPVPNGFPPSIRGSPFPSPRPSPRLAYSSPLIPHSPTLNNYVPVSLPLEDMVTPPDVYGDYGNDTVSWLIEDDNALFGPQATDNMSPHDMLRSVLGEARSDQEIDAALEACSYDLGATLAMLMDQQTHHHSNGHLEPEPATINVGKSMATSPERVRPFAPRSGVVCRFFLSMGQCLRADCRFSHDLGTTICKYWLNGGCLAGDTCIFSHDPTMAVSRMTLDANSRTSTPSPQAQQTFHDPSAFPKLSGESWAAAAAINNGNDGTAANKNNNNNALPVPVSFRLTPSRPKSRQQQSRERVNQTAPPSGVPQVDDDAAFPSLGSVKVTNKKRGGVRKPDIPTGPASLADVVRMSPAAPINNRWAAAAAGGPPIAPKTAPSAAHIPPPQHIPWLDTGSAVNRLYLKHRKEALNHGAQRAKYLQLAANAWHRNDAKAAKEFSRKANSENISMVKCHKEAAKVIYDERNQDDENGAEVFCDLHGLLPEEGVKYLEDILLNHQSSSKPVYAIVGTTHHSKGAKEKLGRAVKAFLDDWRYAYREFSPNGDRNGYGGVLGIDPSSYDKSLAKAGNDVGDKETTGAMAGEKTPVSTTLAKEIPKGPGASRK
ncbi:hypothetical protein EX30DRAFT_338258 [Ascodesmis nigricans]|uniref:DUF1771-domain-containing protein n=1 Tax=Ascodesmis nigricans TaxID=341454 RepID=A0A4S2N3I6_9PEZI|nr:hypothetical protein EX30DRAFT_338258 [Ascodesmis nigricans]